MIHLTAVLASIILLFLLFCAVGFLTGFFSEFGNIMNLPNWLESKGKALAKKIKGA